MLTQHFNEPPRVGYLLILHAKHELSCFSAPFNTCELMLTASPFTLGRSELNIVHQPLIFVPLTIQQALLHCSIKDLHADLSNTLCIPNGMIHSSGKRSTHLTNSCQIHEQGLKTNQIATVNNANSQ